MSRCLMRPTSSALRCPRSRTLPPRRARSPTAEGDDGRRRGGGAMPIQILMPALSPTMTEGNLLRWLKKEGDEVRSGDVLAEIETDKATMEYEAVDDGRLGRILVPEGAQAIKVNQPIALQLAKGEDISALEELTEAPTKAIPAVAPEWAEKSPVQAALAQPAPASSNGRIFASPLARRMAQQAGLDLGAITGSGPQGRIVKADIESALLAMRGVSTAARPGFAAAPQPVATVAPTPVALSK